MGVRWGVGVEGGEAYGGGGAYGGQSSVGGGALPTQTGYGETNRLWSSGVEGASLALSSILSKGGAMSKKEERGTDNIRGSRDNGAVVVSAPPPFAAVYSEEGGGGQGNGARKPIDDSRSRKESDSRSRNDGTGGGRPDVESDDPHRVLTAAREEVSGTKRQTYPEPIGGREGDPLLHALLVSFIRRENHRCPPLQGYLAHKKQPPPVGPP